jgi:hypothetical protein
MLTLRRLLADETGKSKVVPALLLAGAAAGVFYVATFGMNAVDFFTVKKNVNENCVEAAKSQDPEYVFVLEMQRDLDKMNIGLNAEEASAIFEHVDDTFSCEIQYARDVEYPFVDKVTTVYYNYRCRTSEDLRKCEEEKVP